MGCVTFWRHGRSTARSITRWRCTCSRVLRSLATSRAACHASEAASKEALALPVHPDLSEEQIDFVAESVRGFYRG
jgi:dTDP-4-amino-4,6-dideoxygalactose transaminase